MKIPFNLLLCFAIYATPAFAADDRHTKDAIENRPNIVLIFADDLGWSDVGYQGSDFYETPNLDSLAKQGMVFTSGYAAAGNCAPSRACLMSGTYTPRQALLAALHSVILTGRQKPLRSSALNPRFDLEADQRNRKSRMSPFASSFASSSRN